MTPRRMTRACIMVAALASLSCGSKTGLGQESPDAGPPFDAGADAGVDAGFDAGSDAGIVCVPGVVALDESTVEVVFVIDRSGSMGLSFDGDRPGPREQTRWETLEISLSAALIVFDDRIGVGAKFFPTQTIRATEGPCDVFGGLEVGIGPGRVPGIVSQFARFDPSGGTPLALAMREAVDALLARADENSAQFIVAATDGAPSCSDDAEINALELIREAHEDHGIDVFVLGIASTPPEVALLEMMADLGGRPRPAAEGRSFYDARDPDLLESLLGEIARDLTQCVFAVPIPPDEDDVIEVLVAGETIPRDEGRTEGWDFTNESRAQLSLFGRACEAAIASGGMVRAIITCN